MVDIDVDFAVAVTVDVDVDVDLYVAVYLLIFLLHFYVAVFHEREVFPSHREVVVLENDGEDRWENAIIILLFFFISNMINICIS